MQWLAAGSAAVGITAAGRRGDQSQAQYESYAQANEYNAAVGRQRATTVRQYADQQASSVLNVSGMREEQQRRSAGFAAGTRRASEAQSGTGTDTGSNADVERQSMILSELDALGIRYAGQLQAHDIRQNAEVNAHDLETGATLDMWSAAQNRTSGQWAQDSATLGMVGEALTGGGMFGKSSAGDGTGASPYNAPRPRMTNIYSNGDE